MPLPGDYFCVPVHGDTGRLIALGELMLKRLAEEKYPDSDAIEYQHAGLYLGETAQGSMIIEAEPGGARIRALHYSPASILWSHLDLTNDQREKITVAACGFKGVDYSFLDYAAIAAHGTGIWVPGLRDYIQSTGHMICSQLVDRCYQAADVQLFADHRWNGYVTPMDLAYEAMQ